MSYYRLYYFNDNNRICAFDEAECEGDKDALAFAEERRRGRQAELWNKDRLVLKLDRGDRAAARNAGSTQTEGMLAVAANF